MIKQLLATCSPFFSFKQLMKKRGFTFNEEEEVHPIPVLNNFDLVFSCFKMNGLEFRYFNELKWLVEPKLLNKISSGIKDYDIGNLRYFLKN